MTHNKHTAGPWFFDMWTIGQDKRQQLTIHCGSDAIAAILPQYMDDDGRQDADARLIAASPDMLAALREAEEVLASYDNYASHGCHGTLRIVRAAITKATGCA